MQPMSRTEGPKHTLSAVNRSINQSIRNCLSSRATSGLIVKLNKFWFRQWCPDMISWRARFLEVLRRWRCWRQTDFDMGLTDRHQVDAVYSLQMRPAWRQWYRDNGDMGPDLPNTSYNYLTTMPKLRSTYDRHPVYKTSYGGCNDFPRYNSLAKS